MKWGEIMEGTFINFLNGILPYLGTGLAVITVSGSLIIGAYKGIKKLISAHDVKIADNIRNQEENDEFKEQFSNFASTLTNVCNKVDEMNERQLAQIEHNNAVDIKLDELSDSIKRDRHDSVRADEEIKKSIQTYKKNVSDIVTKLDSVTSNMELIISSDKEGIKAFITTEYYKAIEKGYIEPYTLQVLEERYETYLRENGNTFVGLQMDELRNLPHTKPKKTATRKKTTTKSEAEK